MKKAFSAFLAAALAVSAVPSFSVAAADADPNYIVTITPDKTTAAPGDTVTYTVAVEAKGNAGLSGLTVWLDIPEGLSFVEDTKKNNYGFTELDAIADTLEMDFDPNLSPNLGWISLTETEDMRGVATPLAKTDIVTFKCTVDEGATGSLSVGITEDSEVNDSDYNSLVPTLGGSSAVTVGEAEKKATAITADSAITLKGKGEKQNVNAKLTPADADDTIEYSTKDSKVATVDKDGNVTAVANGVVDIISKASKAGLEATTKVTVDIPVPDDSSSAAPVDDSSSTAPVDDSSSAAPVDDSSSAAPVDDSSSVAPVDDSSSAAPVDDSSSAAPVDDSSSAAPVDDSSSAAPVDDSSSAAPVDDSSVAPVDDSSTSETPVTEYKFSYPDDAVAANGGKSWGGVEFESLKETDFNQWDGIWWQLGVPTPEVAEGETPNFTVDTANAKAVIEIKFAQDVAEGAEVIRYIDTTDGTKYSVKADKAYKAGEGMTIELNYNEVWQAAFDETDKGWEGADANGAFKSGFGGNLQFAVAGKVSSFLTGYNVTALAPVVDDSSSDVSSEADDSSKVVDSKKSNDSSSKAANTASTTNPGTGAAAGTVAAGIAVLAALAVVKKKK